MTTPSYIIPNLKGEPSFASNIPGFRPLVGPEQWHYCAELMPQVISYLGSHARAGGTPMRPTLVGEVCVKGDMVFHPGFCYWIGGTSFVAPNGFTVLTTRPMPEPPNAVNPLIEKIEQLLAYPMDNRARVLLTLALDIERGKAAAQ